jgi:7-cyano-7-deazaguanine synthase
MKPGRGRIGAGEESDMSEKRAVVLLSGGIDSSTTLAVAVRDGYRAYALSLDYGQRHRAELGCSSAVAERLGAVRHLVLHIDLGEIAPSALTARIEVPKGRPLDEIGGGIPATYVPARNTIFLSLALAWAETLGARDIFIGANAIDYPGYPDCRPEYVRAFEEMANLATRCGTEGHRIRIRAPLIEMTKAEIIILGAGLGIDFSTTISCYSPAGDESLACGECDSCQLRKRGFAEAGIEDPTRYAG